MRIHNFLKAFVMASAAITEKVVKDKIKRIIEIFSKYNDLYTLTPMTMGYGESGHPDRLLLINGMLIGIEAKKDKNNSHSRPELKAKASEVAQKRQAKRIVSAGGEWVCIHNDNLCDLVTLLSKYGQVHMSKFAASDQAAIVTLLGE